MQGFLHIHQIFVMFGNFLSSVAHFEKSIIIKYYKKKGEMRKNLPIILLLGTEMAAFGTKNVHSAQLFSPPLQNIILLYD